MPPRPQRRAPTVSRQLPTRTQSIVQQAKTGGKKTSAPAVATASAPIQNKYGWRAPSPPGGPLPTPTTQVSVCIPTWKRWDFLRENIPRYLANPFVAEIVISDETGEDVAEIKRAYPNESRLVCSVNAKQLGPFLNKEKAVSLAMSEWVCVVDSDNFVPLEYFVAWSSQALDANTVFFPEKTNRMSNHAGFNYNVYDGVDVTADTMAASYAKKGGAYLFNTANYIVNRATYLAAVHNESVVKEGDKKSSCCHMMYKNYLLLRNGVRFHVVPGMIYWHVVHQGSLWKKEARKTNLKLYMDLFKAA
jgi:hypothetical protein